jgi:hypothetical protein
VSDLLKLSVRSPEADGAELMSLVEDTFVEQPIYHKTRPEVEGF